MVAKVGIFQSKKEENGRVSCMGHTSSRRRREQRRRVFIEREREREGENERERHPSALTHRLLENSVDAEDVHFFGLLRSCVRACVCEYVCASCVCVLCVCALCLGVPCVLCVLCELCA